ncbi:hypothetical protein P9112_010286 [Eukaryota sp. TZLM1-RC]
MFLFSLLAELVVPLELQIFTRKSFGYDDFLPVITALSERLPDHQQDLFVDLLTPIVPTPPSDHEACRYRCKDLSVLIDYEETYYKRIRDHCETIQSGDFAKLEFYGHPSRVFVLKRDMGSRTVVKSIT